LTYKFLRRNFKDLRSPRVLELWSSYYGMMTTQRRVSTMFIVIYLLRRFIFAATCVFLKDYPLAQIHSTFLQSILMLWYLLYYWPFVQHGLNYLEVFNEMCIMLCMYPAAGIFTDGTQFVSSDVHYNAGWAFIGIIGFNVGVNLMV
jgi:hypothetical protein